MIHILPKEGSGIRPGTVQYLRGELVAVGECGDGVEAECELWWMVASGSTQDMGGVAVDTGEPGELDGDPGLVGDFTDNGVNRGLADLDPASGSSQLPASMRRTSKSSPSLLRTAANAAGRTSWAVGVLGSWYYSRTLTMLRFSIRGRNGDKAAAG
jgi:hypothetical protein